MTAIVPCTSLSDRSSTPQSGLAMQGTGRPGKPMYYSMRSFLRDARLNSALLVPAGLYSVNNWLKFMMQLYFNPTTAKMLGNLKVNQQTALCALLDESATLLDCAPHQKRFFYTREHAWSLLKSLIVLYCIAMYPLISA